MAVLSLVGTFLRVQYNIPGPVVMHVRFVAAAVDAARPLAYVIRTPDGDMFEEDCADRGDFRQIVAATDHQTVPGFAAARVYGFANAPSAADMALWIATGQAIVAGAIPGLMNPPAGGLAAIAGGPPPGPAAPGAGALAAALAAAGGGIGGGAGAVGVGAPPGPPPVGPVAPPVAAAVAPAGALVPAAPVPLAAPALGLPGRW